MSLATRLLLLAGLSLLAAPAWGQLPANEMRAHFIDVGQGDATLLEFSCGAVLIDAGGQNAETTTRLMAYLRAFFSGRPDLHDTLQAVFITHNHVDHTRALRMLTDSIPVRRLVETGLYGREGDQGDAGVLAVIERAESGALRLTHVDVDDAQIVQTVVGLTGPDIDPVNCPGTDPEIRLLSADLAENPGWPTKEFQNKNNHSLVVRIDFGSASFLFTGDLEEPAIETLVEYYEGTGLLDTDVYQVGHHGSGNGTTTSLMRAIDRPQVAVISMGPCTDQRMWTAWKYGHPRKAAVDKLVSAVVGTRPQKDVWVAPAVEDFRRVRMRKAVYGTGWDGTIVVRATDAGQYEVSFSQANAPASCSP